MKPNANLNNLTLNDVQLAAIYYPILIEFAKHKHCITYGELIQEAKRKHPDNEYIQNAIAVSTGRKLDVIRTFTDDRGLPDVTSLVISKNDGECGVGFTDYFDPKKTRNEVYSFDWSEVSTDFDLYIETAEKQTIVRKKVKREKATKMMSDYFKKNKNNYPSSIREKRKDIIELIMDGYTEEEAFNLVTE